ncbi:MAG: immunity 22 family protein [Gammaproteobacteria bacterium]|nr:immunity 22 family protein [Gammaproteobacteria bacterium]
MASSDSTPLSSFEKHGKVSVWCSSISYDTIPDSYFEENDDGLDAWARNFNISQYDHENMETNGVASGTASVKSIVEDCSYSSGYGEGVIHKINKMGHLEISWLILLFDFEYRNKITKIHEDEYVQYVGSFVYDMDAISLAEQDELTAAREEKLRIESQLALDIAAAVELEAVSAPKEAEPEAPKVAPKSNNPWLKS